MPPRLNYVIRFVANMEHAVQCYRDTLGLPLRFQSPGWSEFDTGATTLALHAADADHPAGHVRLGFRVPDLQRFHAEMRNLGIRFTVPPTMQFGTLLAQFVDCENSEVSVSEERAAGSPQGT